jgi:hypothetical protein
MTTLALALAAAALLAFGYVGVVAFSLVERLATPEDQPLPPERSLWNALNPVYAAMGLVALVGYAYAYFAYRHYRE